MKKVLFTSLLIIAVSICALAQSTTGRLVGTIFGPDGALPGATLIVTDNATGKKQTITANESGSFTVSQLAYGNYTVEVTASGFKTFIANDLKIDAGRDYSFEPRLEIGVATENVTITAGADTINSSDGTLTTTVSPQQIKELPLNGRNPLNLLNLQAGVNATSGSINGQRTSSVNYTRDGLNVQDNFIRNGFVSDQPTVDDTGEFNVVTQNAGAELGAGSTQVQLVTPRGGKDFHGALFAFNRNSKFAANSFQNNATGLQRAFLNRNQFGGSFSGPAPLPNFGEGGPVFRKDKAFFFFNYEGFRLAQQGSITGLTTLLPTARDGTFTYTSTNGTVNTVNVLTGAGLNLTGANATVFANAGGSLAVNPVVKSRILDLLPTSGNGNPVGTNLAQTTSLLRSDPEIRNAYATRFDVDINDKNSFNFVYKRNNILDARTDVAAGFLTGTTVNQGGPTNFFTGSYQTILSNNFTNEVRAGFQKSEPFFLSNGINSNYLFGALPLGITNPENVFQNQGRDTLYRNVQDNAVYTLGNHSLRFGAQIEAYHIVATNFAGVTPVYTFGSTANPLTPGLGNTGNTLFANPISATDLARANALRYLLGGIVGGGSITANLQDQSTGYQLGTPAIRDLNFEIYSGYVSDQWRVRPNITLNFGLRYEVYTPLNDPRGLYLEPVLNNPGNPVADVLNPNGTYNFVGTNNGTKGNFFNADKNNLGPNISIAYTPKFGKGFISKILSESTVLRGGFRIGYVNDEYVRSADNANLNNAGLGSTTVSTGNIRSSFTPIAGFTPLPTFTTAPAFSAPPRTYLQNNIAAGGAGSTVSLIDPHLQNQKLYEYNVGIQRDIGFKTTLELRYVGNFSNQLVRSIDYNQVKVRSSGLLTDFVNAQNNCRLQAVASGFVPTAANPNPLFNCSSAAYNPAIAGSVALPFFSQLGALGGIANGGVGATGAAASNATLLQYLAFDIPADLAASVYVTQNTTNARNLLLANPNTFVANYTTNGGKLRYNSLQAELRRRFSGGLSLQANYTFQKILTNIGTPENDQTRVGAYLDNDNQNLDYSRASYDRTHTFNFNGVYELPFGKGKKFLNSGGVVDKVFGGFQFTSIVTLSSGVPLSIYDTSGTVNRGARSTRQSATSNLTQQEIKKLTGVFVTPNGVFGIDPSVLYATGSNGLRVDLNQPLPTGVTITGIRGATSQDQTAYTGQIFFYDKAGSSGNLTRNFINGPKYINWDAGLSKSFRFTETTRLQLRMEVFNVLNNANFFPSADNIFNVNNTTNFGRIDVGYAPRITQFGARFDF